MTSTGLLVISNVKNITNSLRIANQYVKTVWYVYLNSNYVKCPISWSKTIIGVYASSLSLPSEIDIRVLVTPLKISCGNVMKKEVNYVLVDHYSPEIVNKLKHLCITSVSPTFLEGDPSNTSIDFEDKDEDCMHDVVVLGGTFDCIHIGHKVLLTEAVIRCRKRLVVGVTDENMGKVKILSELIMPLDKRIQHLRQFLEEIDSTLAYEIVPISNPFGPTITDPHMSLIVVSSETMKGANSVNDARRSCGLNPLSIHSIPLLEIESACPNKELKISSSNRRMDLLGTRLKTPEPRPNLKSMPYIIGLTGNIASGKSVMAERFRGKNAYVIDCDKVAHEIYEPRMKCYNEIVNNFGEIIIGDDGKINRKVLGDIVFNDSNQLNKLNEIVWPILLSEVKSRIKEIYEKNHSRIIVVEAAVLLQAGWQKECHEIWSVIVTEEEAIKRVVKRNKITEEEARKRIKSQLSNKEIVEQSHVVFSTQWNYEFTQEQFEKAWLILTNELKQLKVQ